ncbi:MAG: hypothetical protein KF861_12155 [Planctomycetaceae bacterium]|nr:hypothetical protein [Planctomycetaceae bacterium]
MIDQKDFIPRALTVHWLKGIQTDSFDSAIEAANEWIVRESIDVLNVETIVLPIGMDNDTEVPTVGSLAVANRQFIRVWYRKHQ